MHANKQILSILSKQEILELLDLRDIKTGDTLCDEKHPIILSQ
jgi:hypothetical protein